jgi:hypothetical protein
MPPSFMNPAGGKRPHPRLYQDPKTAMRYNRGRKNLERYAVNFPVCEEV